MLLKNILEIKDGCFFDKLLPKSLTQRLERRPHCSRQESKNLLAARCQPDFHLDLEEEVETSLLKLSTQIFLSIFTKGSFNYNEE